MDANTKYTWAFVVTITVVTTISLAFFWGNDLENSNAKLTVQEPAKQLATKNERKPSKREEDKTETESGEGYTFSEKKYDSVLNRYPKLIEVGFPNGRKLKVEYKLDPRLDLPQPDPNDLSNYIENLISLAEDGDNAYAADQVSELLGICSNAPRSYAALQQAVSAPYDGSSIFPNAESLNYYFEICKNVSNAQIATQGDYLDVALENGVYRAVSNTTNDLLGVDNERRAELLRISWESGNIGLGSSIAADYYTGSLPELNGVPDYVTGYAYHLAQDTVIKSLWEQSSSIQAPQRILDIDQSLLSVASTLTPEQLLQSEALAVRLIEENENCCIGLWEIIEGIY